MNISALFVLSTICLAECYRLSMKPGNGNDLEIVGLDPSSIAVIKEFLSKLLLINSKNVDLGGNLPSSTDETIFLPSANFEENSSINMNSQSPLTEVNNLGEAERPAFSLSQVAVIPQPLKEDSAVNYSAAFPSAQDNGNNQNQGSQRPLLPTETINTSNNNSLLPPQNPIGAFPATPASQNLSAPILPWLVPSQYRPKPPNSSINILSQPTLTILNGQSKLNPSDATNSKLPQPPQSPSFSKDLSALSPSSSSVKDRPVPPSSSTLNRPTPPLSFIQSRPSPASPDVAALLSMSNQNGLVPSAPQSLFWTQ